MIKLVIFDMDGTLIDTERNGIGFWGIAGKEYGYDIRKEDVITFVGKNRNAIEQACYDLFGDDFPFEKVYKRRRELGEIEFQNGLDPMPYAKEALEKINSLGIKMCVATSSSKLKSIEKLKSLGFYKYMEFLVSGEEVENSKPHPDIFLKCINDLNMEAKDCLVIEDSKNGIIGGKKSGAIACLIPDMVPVDDEMRTYADHIFKNLLELADFIESEYMVINEK